MRENKGMTAVGTALVLFVMLALATACGRAADPSPTSSSNPTPITEITPAVATSTPSAGVTESPRGGQSGGTLRYGMPPNVEHLFYVAYSGGAGAAWATTVGDPLMAYGPDATWRPEKSLAESWEVSDDNLAVTFELRQGVKFHDGTDFNADAMKFSLDWVLDPNNFVVWASAIEAVSEVTVIDEHTLSVHTESIFAPILTNLGMNVGMPFSSTALEERGLDEFHSNPAGTGPFMVKEWVSGSHILFERFPDYWVEGAPYLDAWRWEEIPDDRVRAAAMQSGELDVISIAPGALDAIAAVRGIADVQEFVGFAGPATDHINMSRAPFNDIRVRQAAQMAMDRHAWNQAMTGGEGHVYRGSLLAPGHAASFEVPEEEFPYPYDPERARELLEEYAQEKGLTLPLDTLGAFTCTPDQRELGCVDLPEQPITIIISGGRDNIARVELSQAYYEAVGFDVQLEIGAGNEVARTFERKEAGFSLRSLGLRPHPDGTFGTHVALGTIQVSGWGDLPEQIEVDQLLKEARQTFNVSEQNRLYQEVQRIYMEAVLGHIRTANAPSYHFVQPWVKWDQYPDPQWVKFPSDASVKVEGLWLDR